MAAKTPAVLPNLPTFNLDAFIALQKANVETLVQVQKILTDAAVAAWQAQVKRLDAWQTQLEGAFKTFDLSKKPEAYAKEAQSAVESAMAEAKVAVEDGVKVQREVAQILADRAVANLNELKALAA
jgi:hypothetical protein